MILISSKNYVYKHFSGVPDEMLVSGVAFRSLGLTVAISFVQSCRWKGIQTEALAAKISISFGAILPCRRGRHHHVPRVF